MATWPPPLIRLPRWCHNRAIGSPGVHDPPLPYAGVNQCRGATLSRQSTPRNDDNGDGNSGGENSDPEADDLGNTGDDPVAYHKLTKRQRTQLRAFPLEVQTLIRWVFDKIKLNIASLCPFADNMTDELDVNATVFNRWIVERWREANEEICPDMPRFRLRMTMHHIDPDHAAKAKSLTDGGEEQFVSSNEQNDSEMFMHQILADSIENAWFKTAKSFGFKHIEAFTPLVPVRNRIKALEVDISKPAELNAEGDRDAYMMFMEMLEKIRKENPAHLLKIRAKITLQYLKAKPQPTTLPVPEMNLGPDREVPMDMLEEIGGLLGDEALALEEWDGVKEAQKKSKVPPKRTRDTSDDRDTGIRRQRLDFAQSGISRMSAPINRAASVDKSAATTTTSRAGSMAPSAASACSQSSAPSKSSSQRETAVDDDRKFFDLEIGHDEAEDKTEEVRPVRSRKLGQNIKKDPKLRSKKRDYENNAEMLMVIDRTVEEAVALLVPDMCCDELDIPIRRGWARAVKFLHLPPEKWLIDQHAINVCKTLVSGFRSRGRKYFTQVILSHFGLQYGPDLDIEEVKVMAEELLPSEFHRNPNAIGPNAGHYRNAILARGVAVIWMAGNKPTATRFPDALDPVPTLAIAYVAALAQDILKRLAKDSCIKTKKKAKMEEEKEEKARERAAAKARGEGSTRANVDPVRVDMNTHLENLQLFEQIMGPDYHEFQSNLFKDACGKLTAASFADELKQAKARQAAAASGSRSDAQLSRESLTKSRARPTPSSKLPEIEERSNDDPSIGRPSIHHTSPSEFEEPPSPMAQPTKDIHEEEGARSDEESDDEGRWEHPGEPGKSDGSEPKGDGGERDNVSERESTSPSAGKRKSRGEAGHGGHDDPPSEDEEPLKKRKLHGGPKATVPASDEEEDLSAAQDDAGGNERESKAPTKTPTTHSSPKANDEANDDPPPGGTVPSGGIPSSPLSESPSDSSTVVKRATRLSTQSAQDALSAKEAMRIALEKRKQEEVKRRERAAQKKREEEDAQKAENAAYEELERKVKGAKPAKEDEGGHVQESAEEEEMTIARVLLVAGQNVSLVPSLVPGSIPGFILGSSFM
ncbi:hypothetical protein RhiLY_11619 [Ceratobasidium sp. AG-Ba]|nr:hypothetical protein RhiLY_11619 [Ceratobasidium sp. AG-Ba]